MQILQLKLLLDEAQNHLDVAQREAQAQREELSLVSGGTEWPGGVIAGCRYGLNTVRVSDEWSVYLGVRICVLRTRFPFQVREQLSEMTERAQREDKTAGPQNGQTEPEVCQVGGRAAITMPGGTPAKPPGKRWTYWAAEQVDI